jgi:hypothetical protein
MKNVRSVLSHLSLQPQFKSLRRHTCYRKFIQLLPQKFQRAIAFAYSDKETLFLALSHPGYKMELNYNRDLLKSVLTMLREHDESCREIKADKIVIFNSRYAAPTQNNETKTDPKYHELSRADFLIRTEDKALKEKFEAIKKTILSNQDNI